MDRSELPSRPISVILAITGGSGSGKTTIADALAAAVRAEAATLRSLVVLREDDYYRDNRATPGFHPGRFNFDDLATRDHGLLVEHLRRLKTGLPIDMPRYDYVEHTRLPERITVAPTDIVIIEGTHLLCSAALRALYDLTIYLDVPDDVRFTRRLLRDVAERGRSVETVTSQYLGTVRPMHYRFTEPTRRYADRVVTFDETMLTAAPDERADRLRGLVEELAQEIMTTLMSFV